MKLVDGGFIIEIGGRDMFVDGNYREICEPAYDRYRDNMFTGYMTTIHDLIVVHFQHAIDCARWRDDEVVSDTTRKQYDEDCMDHWSDYKRFVAMYMQSVIFEIEDL